MSTDPSPLNVLVTGAGLVGKAVIEALIDPLFNSTASVVQMKPFLLVRPASRTDATKRGAIEQYAAKGVMIVEGDVEDIPAMTHLLQANAIHTVVSVIGYHHAKAQLALVDAAKAAGVRRFIPSDFGLDIDLLTEDNPSYAAFKTKQVVHAAIKASGMDWTFIACGAFAELVFNTPIIGVDAANRSVSAPTSFDLHLTITSLRDIGTLTATAVTDAAARNKQLYLGKQYTYEQVAHALESALGERVTRRVQTKGELEAALIADPTNAGASFGLASIMQTGTTWPEDETYKYGQFTYTPLETVARRAIDHN